MPLWTILTKCPDPWPPQYSYPWPGGASVCEERLDDLERRPVAADHEAVADLEAPDAAAGAGVEVADALRVELRAALDVVLERRVAAVDEDVAFVEQRRELVDRRLRRVAVGEHDPDRARRLERLDDVGELPDRLGALSGQLLGLGVGAVPHHDAVTAAQQPARHVAAHAAQPDHRYVHLVLLVMPGKTRRRTSL